VSSVRRGAVLFLFAFFLWEHAAQAQITVAITPTSATVATGQTLQFTAKVTTGTTIGCGLPCTMVNWSVNGTIGGSSAAGTITTDGLYTAPSSVPAGSIVTVTATSVADPTKSASASVTITGGVPVQISIAPMSIALDPGGLERFSATVTGAANTAVTWAVNGYVGGNNTIGTITLAGLYSAPSVAPPGGTVTVTATSVADPTKSASATVTINSIQVFITPTAVSVQVGMTQQFTATISAYTNPAMTWSVNGVVGGYQAAGTVSTTGLYTAPLTWLDPKPVWP
jgi:hypothetical protein